MTYENEDLKDKEIQDENVDLKNQNTEQLIDNENSNESNNEQDFDIKDFIEKNKSNDEFLKLVKPLFSNDEQTQDVNSELEELREFRKKIEEDQLLKEYSEDPKKVLLTIKEQAKKEFEYKEEEYLKKLESKEKELEKLINEKFQEKVNREFERELGKYSLIDVAKEDISIAIQNKFKLNDDDQLIDETGKPLSVYLSEYIEKRPYLKAVKSGTGFYSSGKKDIDTDSVNYSGFDIN